MNIYSINTSKIIRSLRQHSGSDGAKLCKKLLKIDKNTENHNLIQSCDIGFRTPMIVCVLCLDHNLSYGFRVLKLKK